MRETRSFKTMVARSAMQGVRRSKEAKFRQTKRGTESHIFHSFSLYSFPYSFCSLLQRVVPSQSVEGTRDVEEGDSRGVQRAEMKVPTVRVPLEGKSLHALLD